MQQSEGRKQSIDKRITDTHNKKSKMSAFCITYEIHSVVAATITGFKESQRDHNEADSSSGSPHINGSNAGANRKTAATANSPE